MVNEDFASLRGSCSNEGRGVKRPTADVPGLKLRKGWNEEHGANTNVPFHFGFVVDSESEQ